MSGEKLKLGIYWGAACGGCDVGLVDLAEDILKLTEVAKIVFWPCAVDFKYKDVEAYPDKEIDVCFFSGGVRNTEQEELAYLLRQKSKTLIAFGACACFGGIPGLANLTSKEAIFDEVYQNTPSTFNPEELIPQEETIQNDCRLRLPEFYNQVFPLNKKVEVDYYLPGCPPPQALIKEGITAIIEGKLPLEKNILGGGKPLCDECKKETQRQKKEARSIERIFRIHEIQPDLTKCFLDEGIICLGPVTRSGCGARCIKANMPCRGCMGSMSQVNDAGASYATALASLLGLENEKELSEEEIQKLMSEIKDPVGTFYRFSLPISFLRKRQG
jgi:F420-non-reducing hydrogenase small subunit